MVVLVVVVTQRLYIYSRVYVMLLNSDIAIYISYISFLYVYIRTSLSHGLNTLHCSEYMWPNTKICKLIHMIDNSINSFCIWFVRTKYR